MPADAKAAADRPGVLVVAGERMFVGCGEGVVELLSVQPEGKCRMSAAAFLRGYRSRMGERIEPADVRCRPAEEPT